VPFKSGPQNRDRNILILVGVLAMVVVVLAWWLGIGGSLGIGQKSASRVKAPTSKSSGQQIKAKGAGIPGGQSAGKESEGASQAPAGQTGQAAPGSPGQPGQPAPAQAADPMDSMVTALVKAGLDTSLIKIDLASSSTGEVVQLELNLNQDAKPKKIQDAVQAFLSGAGHTAQWKMGNGQMVAELMREGRITHRLVLKLPPGVQTYPNIPVPLEQEEQPEKKQPQKTGKPMVAIIIDDMGYQLGPAKELLDLDLNLSFAVLPNSVHAKKVAAMIKAKGRDLMMHLPMEPKGYPDKNPGQNALLMSMEPAEIERLTKLNLEMVPGAVGVNNHMGSAYTENPVALEPALRVIKAKGLFFLDSITTSKSQAYALSRQLGLKCIRRDVFLDHDHNPDVIMDMVTLLVRRAEKRGWAIAIGHPIPSTITVLKEISQSLQTQVEVVPVSRLIPQ
jgi:polysaccharide deacetylase 2 family uncharacterized protein YibQ